VTETLAGALAVASDKELLEALQSLTKQRRYHIKGLAEKLEPEEYRKRLKEGGKKGGKNTMAKLTQEQKTELGKNAATSRWGTPRKHLIRLFVGGTTQTTCGRHTAADVAVSNRSDVTCQRCLRLSRFQV
jgi:hypothetical protein